MNFIIWFHGIQFRWRCQEITLTVSPPTRRLWENALLPCIFVSKCCLVTILWCALLSIVDNLEFVSLYSSLLLHWIPRKKINGIKCPFPFLFITLMIVISYEIIFSLFHALLHSLAPVFSYDPFNEQWIVIKCNVRSIIILFGKKEKETSKASERKAKTEWIHEHTDIWHRSIQKLMIKKRIENMSVPAR